MTQTKNRGALAAAPAPKHDLLGRLIGSENSQALTKYQARHLERRFGLAPTRAALVAEHAFHNGRRA